MNRTQITHEKLSQQLQNLSNILNPGSWILDYYDEVNLWEKSFFCNACLNRGRENFHYLESTAVGETHLCDNCGNSLVTGFEPLKYRP